MQHPLRAVLPAACLCILLAGCTGTPVGVTASAQPTASTTTVPEPAIGPAMSITSTSQVVRPIDTYLPDAAEISDLIDAQVRQVNECLDDGGFTDRYAYPSAAETKAFVASSVNDRITRSSLWGFFSPDTAREHGYQRPEDTGSLTVAPLSPEATQACVAVDESSFEPLLYAYESVLPQGGPIVPSEDSRTEAAVAAWASCMKGQGFDYSSPLEPIDQFAPETDVSARHLATATADIECKISTNLVGQLLAVQTAYDQVYIEGHEGDLAEFEGTIDDYLRAGAGG